MLIKIISLIIYVVGALILFYFKKREGKDERGKHILSTSLEKAFILLFVGIVILIAYDKYNPFSHDALIMSLYSILSISIVLNSCLILILRKKL